MAGFLKSCLYWVVSIFVGLFSILFLIGFMAEWRNPSDGPRLKGAGPEDVEEKVPAGQPYEIPTMMVFLAAATSGIMPGGNRTELPVFPQSEMALLSKKYEEWAPEPFNKLPGPQGIFGPATAVSPPPLIRWMHILGGLDDIFAMAFTNPQTLPLTLERSFKVVKTKVWLGMAPVTEARWRAKGLDAQDNIEEALAIIEQVVEVWKHLAKPEIQGDLRTMNNKLWAEIDVFQDAVNAMYTAKGEPSPEWNLTKLWEAFNDYHFLFIEQQSRAWTLAHLKTLHGIWKTRFLDVFQSGRTINSTQATVKIDHYAMLIMNKIQDLQFDADIYIRRRFDGFVTASREIHPQMANIEAPKEELNRAYAGIEANRIAAMKEAFRQVTDARTRARRAEGPTPGFLLEPSLRMDREFAHKELQQEIDRPLEMGMERWVRMQMEGKVERFGFVIYRLGYEQSDKEWDTFKEKLETGIESGLDGLVGWEGIKGKATLHWVDGREEKIPEGDVEAARKDFNTISALDTFPSNITKSVFLAITPHSILSFADARSGDRKGDYRGFLLAVDPAFSSTPDAPNRNKGDPKGYDGMFKIIDQLVWTDLFAVHVACGSQTLQDYWSLATQHPWGVYVGPTTGVRRRQWREMTGGLGLLLQAGKNMRPEGRV